MVKVINLLGGFFGPDGWVLSRGMLVLADQLNAIPGVTVTSYSWSEWDNVTLTDDTNCVIGYSGGGSRATWLANADDVSIDLMVLFDPSPAWQMQPIGANVKRAICFYNNAPMMFGLGGGVLATIKGGPVIETVEISEQHLFVQLDQSLRDQTIAAVRALSSTRSLGV